MSYTYLLTFEPMLLIVYIIFVCLVNGKGFKEIKTNILPITIIIILENVFIIVKSLGL